MAAGSPGRDEGRAAVEDAEARRLDHALKPQGIGHPPEGPVSHRAARPSGGGGGGWRQGR